jgi:hypothetical protein
MSTGLASRWPPLALDVGWAGADRDQEQLEPTCQKHERKRNLYRHEGGVAKAIHFSSPLA